MFQVRRWDPGSYAQGVFSSCSLNCFVHNKELDPEDSRLSNMNKLSFYLASDTVLDIVPMSLVSY